MAITSQEQNLLIKLVIGMFGIAPGNTYLQVVNRGFEDLGSNFSDAASALANLPQFRAAYPSDLTASAFAAKLLDAFGLRGDANAQRLVEALFAEGVKPEHIILEAIRALSATTAPEYADARALLNNRADVAYFHAQILGRSETDFALLAKVIEGVTEDPNSVESIKLVLNPPSPPASPPPPPPASPAPPPVPIDRTFSLTAGADTFIGGAGNDRFEATVGPAGTIGSLDVLTGGAGTDTLSLLGFDNVVTDLVLDGTKITQIENVHFRSTVPTVFTINLGSMGGLQTAGQVGSSVAFAALFKDVPLGTDVVVKDNHSATTVNFDTASLAGSNDVARLFLSNAGNRQYDYTGSVGIRSMSPVANQFERLEIQSDGTWNQIFLNSDTTQTSLASIVITGAAPLQLRFAPDNIRTSLANIDASATTGGVVIGKRGSFQSVESLTSATNSVKLGSGDDQVNFGASLDPLDSVDGRSGRDTLGVTSTIGNGDLSGVTNFEVIHFDVATASLAQDASIASLAGYELEVSGSKGFTLNNVASGSSLKVVGGIESLRETLADPTGATDLVVLTLAGGSGMTNLFDIPGLETLHIVSEGAAPNGIFANGVTAPQLLTGSANFTSNGELRTDSFDASGFSGRLFIMGQSGASTTIKGGSGDDYLIGGTAADVLLGGAGNDTFELGIYNRGNYSGADQIWTGSGNDVIRFIGNHSSGSGAETSYDAFAQIKDFTVGAAGATDRLAFSASNADFVTLPDSNHTGLSKGATAWGLGQADLMVVQDVAKDSGPAVAASSVSFFKLTTHVSFAGNVQSSLASALGTASISGLSSTGNYLISMFDSTNSQMVVAVVHVGTGADTTLAQDDFAHVGVVGVVAMTSSDYDLFGASQLTFAF